MPGVSELHFLHVLNLPNKSAKEVAFFSILWNQKLKLKDNFPKPQCV